MFMTHEHKNILNERRYSLLHKVKESFQALTGLNLEFIFNGDVYLKIKNGGTITAHCCIKSQLRPSTLPIVLDECQKRKPAIVVTDFVSKPIAEKLRHNKIWFIDTVGNAYIEIPGKLFVYIIGKTSNKIYLGKNTLKTENGAKLMLYILTHGPDFESTYRRIAEETGVSLGRISHLMKALLKNEIIHKTGTRYSVVNGKAIFEMWIEAYIEKLKPKHFKGVYLSKYHSDLVKLYDVITNSRIPVGIGDELGGEVLTNYLKAKNASLWTRLEDFELLRKELKLLKTERGNIRVYELFNPKITEWSPLKGIMPVPMIIGDLLETDDVRCRETAIMLREKFLKWTM